MVTIKVVPNGPYLVDGDNATVIDWNGRAYPVATRHFAICRCGTSAVRPFCDGTHGKIGFTATEAAGPGTPRDLT